MKSLSMSEGASREPPVRPDMGTLPEAAQRWIALLEARLEISDPASEVAVIPEGLAPLPRTTGQMDWRRSAVLAECDGIGRRDIRIANLEQDLEQRSLLVHELLAVLDRICGMAASADPEKSSEIARMARDALEVHGFHLESLIGHAMMRAGNDGFMEAVEALKSMKVCISDQASQMPTSMAISLLEAIGERRERESRKLVAPDPAGIIPRATLRLKALRRNAGLEG